MCFYGEILKFFFSYRNYPKFSDRYVRSNSEDPYQTAPLLLHEQSAQGLHCLLFHLQVFDKIPSGLASKMFEF